jgi:CDP-diacylglycerol--glycerol-3-phosphate 3-phosphatidyltransferase
MRVLLAPSVVLLAYKNIRGVPMLACIAAALLSDYFDGVIARRLGVSTARVRRLDSLADTAFYVGVLLAAWLLERSTILHFKFLFIALLALEAIRIIFDRIKFGQNAAYHMWSSKIWGLLLACASVALLAYGFAGWLLAVALIIGLICDAEGLAISIVLTDAQHDVSSIMHAVRHRRTMQAS